MDENNNISKHDVSDDAPDDELDTFTMEEFEEWINHLMNDNIS